MDNIENVYDSVTGRYLGRIIHQKSGYRITSYFDAVFLSNIFGRPLIFPSYEEAKICLKDHFESCLFINRYSSDSKKFCSSIIKDIQIRKDGKLIDYDIQVKFFNQDACQILSDISFNFRIGCIYEIYYFDYKIMNMICLSSVKKQFHRSFGSYFNKK